jgi:uncharacterized metal-binding protein YceD (DUF177 family)
VKGGLALRSDFKIPFVGLKLGKHEFRFTLDNSFFGSLGIEPSNLLVSRGELSALVLFDKQQENIFHLDFYIDGTLVLNCERCLDDFNYSLDIHETLLVKIGEEDFDDPDILIIPKNEFQLNVAPLIYEFISLALPLIQVHPLDSAGNPECNNETAEVIKRFQNPEIHEILDPRWEALKNLKNKKE